MSGHKKWSEIRKHHHFTPEQEAEIAANVREMARENALAQLGRLHEVGQAELVEMLGMTPEEIARIEGAGAPRLATLRRFVEALGSELVLQARYDGETFDRLPPSAVSGEQAAMGNERQVAESEQRTTLTADR